MDHSRYIRLSESELIYATVIVQGIYLMKWNDISTCYQGVQDAGY